MTELKVTTGATSSERQIDLTELRKERGLIETSPPAAVTRCFANIDAEKIEWLWPGRIARGKVSLIGGHPGLGKSQITASLASIITTGGLWPVDRTRAPQGSVLLLSAEDDAADTIKPRLLAAGADCNRVHILDAIPDGSVERTFNLNTDIERLRETLNGLQDAALVIIDPISAYLGGRDSHSNAEVREILTPLSKLAADSRASILAITHLNKSSNDPLKAFIGSVGFIAAARSVYAVVKDPEDDAHRLLLPVKNNLGKDGHGLGFRIESKTVKNDIETSRVTWDSEPCSVSAMEAMNPENSGEGSALDEAVHFLQIELAGGPVKAKTITARASGAAIAKRTLERAKKQLGIKPQKVGTGIGDKSYWAWQLPPEKTLRPPENPYDRHAPGVAALAKSGGLSDEFEDLG